MLFAVQKPPTRQTLPFKKKNLFCLSLSNMDYTYKLCGVQSECIQQNFARDLGPVARN